MRIHFYGTAEELGRAAATHGAESLRALAERLEVIPVMFATGASQFEMLKALTAIPDLPWDRVVGFHMDEYVGISEDHPASFRRYLREKLVSKVAMRQFHYVGEDPDEYAAKLRELPPQLCFAGIGENGHLAFNDPPIADFDDPKPVKLAELDRECRQQQVNEGWFPSIQAVPEHAITVTIPALMQIPELILSVPGERKAEIVKRAVYDEISTACPATILRRHSNAHVYLDNASARLLDREALPPLFPDQVQ